MKFISLFVTITVFLTILLPSFAQESEPEKYIVRTVYFLPKDREPRQDIDAKIDKMLKRVQKFYADQMENYGYDRKTFRYETDPDGKVVVHHIVGKHDDAHYRKHAASSLGECAKIQTPNTILLIFIDVSGGNINGSACGVAYSGGRILIPAYGYCFNWNTTAHELGHTFVLPHDFRSGRYIMSYGPGPQDRISECAAAWLSLNPYFNGGRVSEVENGVKVERLPSIAYPPENLHLFFKITDSEGLYHLRFLHLHTMMHSCKTLSGNQATVKFDTSTVEGKKRVNIQTVDRNGNARYSGWFSFGDIEPTLILDISGQVTDVPDKNYTSIRGPWLWMIAPTEENMGGKDSTHIDSLAVVSANTVTEETVSKYGANEGDTVGDYVWTLGEIPPNGNINTMLVNIDMTENTDLDDFTSYAFTTLVSETDQPNVMMRVGSDDSIKVWLNGEVVWSQATNRAYRKNDDVFPVNLKKGDNLLLVKVSDRSGSWGMHVGVDAEVFPVYRVPTTTPVYSVAIGGVCNLAPEISNASADIEYILTVMNTGNTKDTIKLATSGNTTYLRSKKELDNDDLLTDTTLSPVSVSLAPGASSKVALVVPGFVRATAGDYVVKVTAASENDNTKTAQIITTATIKPFHGVVLAGVDDLTTKTSDVNTDVKYALTVTNTGNINDTIKLTTSGEATPTLSQKSVSLAPGNSLKVILTIPGTALATAGDYAVNVIATSEGDNTKTDQIRTITNVHSDTIPDTEEIVDPPVMPIYQVHNRIRGPWLWMIAPTKQNQGGKDSTHIDSLAVVSASTVNEETVSKYGANEGDTVGDYVWTLGEIPTDGNINTMLMNIGMTENTDLNDFTSYALITLKSQKDQPNVTMRVGSDDSIKVWLNGEVVFSNATNRGHNDTLDVFPVNLKKGDNLLLVKVSERAGTWGMHVGVDTEIFPVYRVPTTTPVYGVALVGMSNLTTEATNARAGIKYIFKVTNIGNTKDTIKLATSGNVTATLSQPSVWLAPGVSSKVTLTIPATALAAVGDYEVKVAATSESDSTKTAQITTTTTIKP